MGKFYNLPISNEAGGSLTFRPDVQNGAEAIAYLLASHCGGQNIIGGIGSMDNANGMSAEQIIMHCGLVDMAEYLSKGVDISDHKLAYESIKNIGPGGNFMTEDLTMELLSSDEFFRSDYFDFSGGYDPGKPGMYQKAHEKANQLVADYKSEVPDKVIAAVKDYFKEKYQDKKVADI
jgi:trimethylamine---corrinoid protein Co-methyltransferase